MSDKDELSNKKRKVDDISTSGKDVLSSDFWSMTYHARRLMEKQFSCISMTIIENHLHLWTPCSNSIKFECLSQIKEDLVAELQEFEVDVTVTTPVVVEYVESYDPYQYDDEIKPDRCLELHAKNQKLKMFSIIIQKKGSEIWCNCQPPNPSRELKVF